MQEAHRLAKLEPPGRGRTVSMVLDTDTFNEVDDPVSYTHLALHFVKRLKFTPSTSLSIPVSGS